MHKLQVFRNYSCLLNFPKGGVVGLRSEYHFCIQKTAVPLLLLRAGTRSEKFSIDPHVKIADVNPTSHAKPVK